MDAKAIARGYDSEQHHIVSSGSQSFSDQEFIQSNVNRNGKIGSVVLGDESHTPQTETLQENQYMLAYAHGMKTEPETTLETRPTLALAPEHFTPKSFPGSSGYKQGSVQDLCDSNTALNPMRPSCCQKKYENTEKPIVEPGNGYIEGKTSSVQNLSVSSNAHHYPPQKSSFDPKLNYSYKPSDHQWIPQIDQTTLYTLPPTYATASHPLNPAQLAQLQHNHTGFSQMVPQYAPSGLLGSAAPSAEGIMMFNPAHNCNCGDDCLCLGCAAHPYNSTTRHHVQDLRQILENSHEATGSSSRPQSSYGNSASMIDVHSMTPRVVPSIRGDPTSPARPNSFQASSLTGPNFHPSSNNSSPTELTFPMFSSSGYYTMEFPLEQDFPMMGCTDVSGSCKCGSDCACIGCLTHTGHVGDTLTDPITAQEQSIQPPPPAIAPVSNPPTPATPRSSCCG